MAHGPPEKEREGEGALDCEGTFGHAIINVLTLVKI
jgi:hypothetical protein